MGRFSVLALLLSVVLSPLGAISMYDALNTGNLEQIKVFVEQLDVDVNALIERDGKVAPPLSWAVTFAEDPKIVAYLLSKGAKPNRVVRDAEGIEACALELAALRGRYDLVSVLLRSGADPNVTMSVPKSAGQKRGAVRTFTVLDALLISGSPSLRVYQLLHASAPKLSPQLTLMSNDESLFWWAIVSENPKEIKRLLAGGFAPTEKDLELLEYFGNSSALRLLRALGLASYDETSVDWKAVRILTSYVDAYFIRYYVDSDSVFDNPSFVSGARKLGIDLSSTISSLDSFVPSTVSNLLLLDFTGQGRQTDPTALVDSLHAVPLESIRLSQNAIVFQGLAEPLSLNVTLIPENTTEVRLAWASSDTAVFSVSDEGVVTPEGVGQAILRVSGAHDLDREIPVNVEPVPTRSILVSPTSLSLEVPSVADAISVRLDPLSSTDQVWFESSNPSVVTVDGKGVVTAVGEGAAAVSVRSGTVSQLIPVAASLVPVQSIAADVRRLAMYEGADSSPVGIKVSPENASLRKATFTTSNPGIVTVDTRGVLHAVAAGRATVKVELGGKVDTVEVTVAHAYKVLESGPAGGIIFFDKGCDSDGWRFLEAAPADCSQSSWSDRGTNRDIRTGARIGEGKRNTNSILAAQGRGLCAAQLCMELASGGFHDWHLPSKEELKLLYTVLASRGLGDFQGDWYWSSSQDSFSRAWGQSIKYGFAKDYNKEDYHYVRAIRAF